MTLLLPGFSELFVPRASDDREVLGLDPMIATDEMSFPLVCLSCRSFETSRMLRVWRDFRIEDGKDTDLGDLFSISPRVVLAIGSLLSRSTPTPRGDSLVFPEGWILRPGRVHCPTEATEKAFFAAMDSTYQSAGSTANLDIPRWGM
jgi:hypothetical protein